MLNKKFNKNQRLFKLINNQKNNTKIKFKKFITIYIQILNKIFI